MDPISLNIRQDFSGRPLCHGSDKIRILKGWILQGIFRCERAGRCLMMSHAQFEIAYDVWQHDIVWQTWERGMISRFGSVAGASVHLRPRFGMQNLKNGVQELNQTTTKNMQANVQDCLGPGYTQHRQENQTQSHVANPYPRHIPSYRGRRKARLVR